MKFFIPILFSILFLNIAQAQDFDWAISPYQAKTFHFGFSIHADPSGNVYTSGIYNDTLEFLPHTGISPLISNGDYDFYIQKVDNSGKILWVKSFGSSLNDNGRIAVIDDKGDILITGSFSETIDFDPGSGTYSLSPIGDRSIFLLKLDSDGNFLWVKSMGGPGPTDFSDIYDLTLDRKGNIFATGYFANSIRFDSSSTPIMLDSKGENDIFVLKLDNKGDFRWAKGMGGAGFDNGFSIGIDRFSNIYTTGTFQATVDFDPNSGIKNILAIGDKNIFFQKLDSLGNLIWVKRIGQNSTATQPFWLRSAIDKAGNLYASGSFTDTKDFDPGTGVYALTAQNGHDAFTLKLDPDGNFLWVKTIRSKFSVFGNNIALDKNDNIYTLGQSQGLSGDTLDFDPNQGVHLLYGNGEWDIFIQKLDKHGNFIWAKSFGGKKSEWTRSLYVDPSQNVYVLGTFEDTVDFDPGAGVYNLALDRGWKNLFILKLKPGMNTSIANFPIAHMAIYPNPSDGNFVIELPLGIPHAQLQILDMLGKTVHQEVLINTKNQLSVSHLSAGFYYLHMTDDSGKRYVGKVRITN